MRHSCILLTLGLLMILTACGRDRTAPATLYRLTLIGAVLTDTGEARDLEMRLCERDGAWTAAFAIARNWNAATHRVFATRLDLSETGLDGKVVVDLLPDAWIPADQLPRQLALDLEASITGTTITGRYRGDSAGTAVCGDLTGERTPLPAPAPGERAGLLRTFLPMTQGRARQVVLTFTTAGGRIERLAGVDLVIASPDLVIADDRVRGTVLLGWDGREPAPVGVDLGVVGDELGGTLAIPGEAGGPEDLAPVAGRIGSLADAQLANRPESGDPFAAERRERIAAVVAATRDPAIAAGFARATLELGGHLLPYRLQVPVVRGDRRYPLVVFLHGAGQRGTDNEKQLTAWPLRFALPDLQDAYPCFVLVPQTATDWGRLEAQAPSGEAPSPGDLVLEVVDRLCRSQPIDRRQVYVTGLSLGGFGTCYLLARGAGRFAAGVPICGASAEAAPAIGGLPLWIVHGDADVTVPATRSRELVKALRDLGHDPLYTEHPLVGHDSYQWAYTNDALIEWLFRQRRTD